MEERIEHGGHTYRIEPIEVLIQLHLARRMSGAMVETIAEGVRKGDASMLLPEVVAWGAMSDADVEFFVNACMGAVRRPSAYISSSGHHRGRQRRPPRHPTPETTLLI
jgi:hypothetical protein